MEAWLMVGTIFGAMMLWRVLLKVWPKHPQWAGILCGGIVIASSGYSLLFTDEPGTLRFRWHLGLVIAMVVAISVHLVKLRRARTPRTS